MSFEDRPFLTLFAITYVLWWIVRHRETHGGRASAHCQSRFLRLSAVVSPADSPHVLRSRLGRRDDDRTRSRPRLWMTLGVTFNLAVLCFYKYTPLVVTTFEPLSATQIQAALPHDFDNWSIPFGISFYSFTGIAYMVDVYRRVHPAEPNLTCATRSRPSFFRIWSRARSCGRMSSSIMFAPAVSPRSRSPYRKRRGSSLAVSSKSSSWLIESGRRSIRSSCTSTTRARRAPGHCRTSTCMPCKSISTFRHTRISAAASA